MFETRTFSRPAHRNVWRRLAVAVAGVTAAAILGCAGVAAAAPSTSGTTVQAYDGGSSYRSGWGGGGQPQSIRWQ